MTLTGKTVVITGATSGVGQATAEKLASMGARIVQVARDRARGEAALRRLAGAGHTIHYADLSLMRESARIAAEIAAAEAKVDILINNAGAMFGTYEETEEGLERTFALNHMSYFVFTLGLLDRLSKSARVVNVASEAHQVARLDFDDLQSRGAYQRRRLAGPGFGVYCGSKLCNVLFTRELAKRLAGAGVTANSLHPGFVATRFGDNSGGRLSLVFGILKRMAAISPEASAEYLVRVATDPAYAAVTGGYFVKGKPAQPSKAAQDDASAARLWAESERLFLAARNGGANVDHRDQ